MFNEREIRQAVERIMDMFDEEILDVMEDNFSDEMDLSYDVLTQAIRDNIMRVLEYRAVADAGDCIDYFGKELFDQRATFILAYEDATAENNLYSVVCRTELWLLEDMTFAVVRAIITAVESGDSPSCITEYRCLVRTIEDADDIFFEPEDFICGLDDLCTIFCATKGATIYEL